MPSNVYTVVVSVYIRLTLDNFKTQPFIDWKYTIATYTVKPVVCEYKFTNLIQMVLYYNKYTNYV